MTEDGFDMDRIPGHLFRRGLQKSVAVSNEELEEFGLTPFQYLTLAAINTHPGGDITTLSELLSYDRSTMGAILDRLEEKKLIVRKPTSADRRARVLHATPEGKKLARAALAAGKRAEERVLHPLDASEREELLRLMLKLVRD